MTSSEGAGLLRVPESGKACTSSGCVPPGGPSSVSLTVRTLDKNEHRMNVAHDIPVPQLKHQVAELTSIEVASQVSPTPSSLCLGVCVCVCACARSRSIRPALVGVCLFGRLPSVMTLLLRQRLVSGGQEMSLDLRLSDYCKSSTHVIYLVVRFPGASRPSTPHGNAATDDSSGELARRSSGASDHGSPRIVLHGTVTIPVPERDMHRVVHSLLGSQANLSEIVNSVAGGSPGPPWRRARRGNADAARPWVHRGRLAQVRRGQGMRAEGQRNGWHRNSVDVSFRGPEWESMRLWPQSMDFHAGFEPEFPTAFGDDFLYDAEDGIVAEGLGSEYSPPWRRGALGDQNSMLSSAVRMHNGAGRDDSLAALFRCDESGHHDYDDSYISANQTMLASAEDPGDAYYDSAFDGLRYGTVSSGDIPDCDGNDLDAYDASGPGNDDELPMGRLTGKRKHEQMCNSPAGIPLRGAPRRNNMVTVRGADTAREHLHAPMQPGSTYAHECGLDNVMTAAATGDNHPSEPDSMSPSTDLIQLEATPVTAQPLGASTSLPLPVCHVEMPAARCQDLAAGAVAADPLAAADTTADVDHVDSQLASLELHAPATMTQVVCLYFTLPHASMSIRKAALQLRPIMTSDRRDPNDTQRTDRVSGTHTDAAQNLRSWRSRTAARSTKRIHNRWSRRPHQLRRTLPHRSREAG